MSSKENKHTKAPLKEQRSIKKGTSVIFKDKSGKVVKQTMDGDTFVFEEK